MLVRVMNPDDGLTDVSVENLYALARLLKPETAKKALRRVLVELNERGEYFETIAEEIGTSRASAARWAQVEHDRRGRRPGGGSTTGT